jgi:hypothetical protein
MTQSPTVADFIEHHNFSIRDWAREDERGIRWLLQLKTILDETFAVNFPSLMKRKEPTSGALFIMIDRVYEHEAAALISFFTGCWASMEIVVRAVIEAAVTVIFVTQKDRADRLGAHVANYFDVSWKAIDRLGQTEDAEKRRQDLKFREDLMRNAHAREGLPFDSKEWPASVFDRFKAVGMEAEYRHIYHVLSSQAHDSAEALIDYMITRCLSEENPELAASATAEMLFWMRFYLYSGLRYYALAANSVAIAFEWKEQATQIMQVEKDIVKHLENLIRDFDALVESVKR